MDTAKVDSLLQYALLVASEEDAYSDRTLGPIHLLKYVYLADLEYAGQNGGRTYTGVEWKFHNFGPWSFDVYERIDSALPLIGAEKLIISSKYADDSTRWIVPANDDSVISTIEKKLDYKLKYTIKKFVHKFRSDTENLLHYVYQTGPMLTAAPGEIICFKPNESVGIYSTGDEKPLSNKQLKRLKVLKECIQQKMQIKLSERKTVSNDHVQQPRYDDIFFEGQKWIDSLAGDPVEPSSGELHISPDLWKTRFNDEVS